MTALIFVIVAAFFNAIIDSVSFRFNGSIFANRNPLFWNPKKSWRNKWKNGNPDEGEKFIGSSTVFVLWTDAWHLFKSMMLSSMTLAVVLYEPITSSIFFDFLIFKIVYGLIFTLLFDKIFNKNG